MAKFRYIVTCGWEVEAKDSDEAYDKFQEMRLKDAFWDNTCDGVIEIDENGNEIVPGEY